jgi:hypothetical protein
VFAFQSSGQSERIRPAGLPTDTNAIAFGIRAEGALLSGLRDVTPVAEAYFQRFVPAGKRGYVIDSDRYLLGRFKWDKEPVIEDLLDHTRTAGNHDRQELAADRQLLDGLIEIMAPDWKQLSPDRYEYKFVSLAFLGAFRCVVYDVRPLNPEEGGFTGRVYLEDKSWNIVRFTGMNTRLDAMFAPLRSKDSRFRIDSWRVNAAKKRWVPAYAYVEEVAPLDAPDLPLVKGQIRFWGYDRAGTQQQEFTDVVLDESPSTAEDRKQQWSSPQQSQRLFEKQAEENVLNRLFQAEFLGAPGEVEKMLDQVVTNLVITNKLTLSQPVHCRVLLTTPLEAFTIGDYIVVSRGLIDVLPSESGVALILAHQLAHNVLGHRRIDTKFAFADVLRVSDSELLAKLRFHYGPDEEAEANAEAMKILEQSPYGNTMSDGGLVMEALQAHAKQLSNLIQPHFGEHVADVDHVVRNDEMFRTVAVHDEALVDQVAALPLGSKLLVNPWDGGVKLFRSEPVGAPALRERAEFAVTPFMPFLDYFIEKASVPKPADVTAQRGARRDRQTTSRSAPAVKKGAS